jgi:hypothetical protein
MDSGQIAEEISAELVQWFSVELDLGDFPELHLAGLERDELLKCFTVLQSLASGWSDRTFHIDAQGIDVTVGERPDVAELVRAGQVSVACVGTDQIEVQGVRLPLVDMFLYPSEIQFFWRPGPWWPPVQIATFLGLLIGFLDLAPGSELRPDPRYPVASRERLGRALGAYSGLPSRVSTR